jgi:hypothetical protein
LPISGCEPAATSVALLIPFTVVPVVSATASPCSVWLLLANPLATSYPAPPAAAMAVHRHPNRNHRSPTVRDDAAGVAATQEPSVDAADSVRRNRRVSPGAVRRPRRARPSNRRVLDLADVGQLRRF